MYPYSHSPATSSKDSAHPHSEYKLTFITTYSTRFIQVKRIQHLLFNLSFGQRRIHQTPSIPIWLCQFQRSKFCEDQPHQIRLPARSWMEGNSLFVIWIEARNSLLVILTKAFWDSLLSHNSRRDVSIFWCESVRVVSFVEIPIQVECSLHFMSNAPVANTHCRRVPWSTHN